jgi:hypothetical protein
MLVGDLMRRLGFALRCSEKSLVQVIEIVFCAGAETSVCAVIPALALVFLSGDTCGGWRSIQVLADFHRPLAVEPPETLSS